MPKFKHLILLRRIMMWLNFFAILFNATLFIYATDYVIRTEQSYQLLSSLHHIPDSPQTIFWQSISSFMVLAVVISVHHHSNEFNHNLELKNSVILTEFLLAIIVFASLRMTYNGIFLFIFVDFIISNRNQYNFHDYLIWTIVIAFLLLVLLVTDYSILSRLTTLPNLTTYLSFLPAKIGPALI
ncbi:hypothetical protein EQ500_04660, partial [Lactobacillus sp. XV13L]|nr:hypothetical protein [Lactobacillus sp. XV13L]